MRNLALILIALFVVCLSYGQTSRTVNISAGDLQTTLTPIELNEITNLTITGTIDARDFKTMRDDMPVLAELDLSEISVLAYSGEGGTNPLSWGGYGDYPANTVPNMAFSNSETGSYDSILNTVDLPASIITIGRASFRGCLALNSFTFPPLVTSIEMDAFSNCTNLSSIALPNSVLSLGWGAFYNCSNTVSIEIPSSLTSIEEAAFARCSGLITVDPNNSHFSSIDGVLFNKSQTNLIHCPISKTGSYVIPSTVNILERFAFELCEDLTSITLPSSVISIGDDVFAGCHNLTSINIPNSVISIGQRSFTNCRSLSSISIPSSVKSIGYAAFWQCYGLSSIYAYSISPIDLSSSSNVFYSVDKNTCVLTVPYGSISQYQAANQWQDFTNIVDIPGIFLSSHTMNMALTADTITFDLSSSESWTASSDQPWLTVNPTSGPLGSHILTLTTLENPGTTPRSATVTVSATGLESQSLMVSQLSKVEVTAGNLKTLLAGQLSTITNLTLSGTIDARDFKTMRDDMPVLAEIDLSEVTVLAYSGEEGTSPYAYHNDYPENVVPVYAFWNIDTYVGKTSLTSLTFPPSITSIEESAIRGCSGLTSITIPPLVTTIGYASFHLCSGLTSVLIPSSVISIAGGAFSKCNNMATVHLPSSVNFVGNGAFWSLLTVDPTSPYFSAVDGVLFNKTQTTLVLCPHSKTGSYLIPSTVESIGQDAFNYCSGLTSITIPSSVTSIGIASFFYCTGLTSLSIPSSVNSIKSSAFYNCNALTSIYSFARIPVDLINQGGVFGEIDKVACTLQVPYGSSSLYASANQWQEFTNIVEMQGFSISDTSVNISYEEGSTGTVDISSDITWNASSDQTWLTLDPSSGIGEVTMTSTANANTESTPRLATITVTGGGVESRNISVTQEGQPFCFPPEDWTVNMADFEYNGQVTAKVFLNDVAAESGFLAAFVDDECRSMPVEAIYFPPGDHYVFEVMCHSDVQSGEILTFKYFDTTSCVVLEPFAETADFTFDMTIGNAINPFELHYPGEIPLDLSFTTGWNWFSVNLLADNMSLGNILTCATEEDYIKNQTVSATYFDDFGWFGSIVDAGGMDPLSLYKIKTINPCDVSYMGIPVDVLTTPINLVPGWNWIGYLPQCSIPIAEALSSLSLVTDDYIKNQTESATYYDGYGWFGSLEELVPGQGYMLNKGSGDVLIYPECPPASAGAKKDVSKRKAVSGSSLDPHKFEFNGSITAQVYKEGSLVGSVNDRVLAYVNGQLRGEVQGIYFEPSGSYAFPLMVFSNVEQGEEVTFRYYHSENDQLYSCFETLIFSKDMIVADAMEAFELHVNAALGIDESGFAHGLSLVVYPNPFKDKLQIEYSLTNKSKAKVAVYDMLGKLVEILDEHSHDPGSYTTEWNAESYPDGTYILKLSTERASLLKRIMLIR